MNIPAERELVQFRNQYTIAKNLNLPGIVQSYNLENYHNAYQGQGMMQEAVKMGLQILKSLGISFPECRQSFSNSFSLNRA
ncbi:hypothetical protein ICL16_39700 [Iningainema sp. BLCCT55]|uniref:Uncharacterized protein n=1 Tax=Iningainema tapete BLCC-T55 TaxID=2748662 RepID=A0A8J7BZN1_9CYAN|nr:hypothetical protein [Iningainema tapete BLCC-T55]